MMKTLAFFLFGAGLLGAEALPSPAHIQLIQEREAHQRSMQIRAAEAEIEKGLAHRESPRELNEVERKRLAEAVRRFLAERRKSPHILVRF